MNDEMRMYLESVARRRIDGEDAAHDFEHARRVMMNALKIGAAEGGDVDVLIPAALFHDVMMFPKNDPRSDDAAHQSAMMAVGILQSTDGYPAAKIQRVADAITHCSFGNPADGLPLDALILQDADRLEATGAIAIMRTFWSAGQMGQPLYDPDDPFARSRQADGLRYAFDLFETRLLRVEARMNTGTGRELARSRTAFLRTFMTQFNDDLLMTRETL